MYSLKAHRLFNYPNMTAKKHYLLKVTIMGIKILQARVLVPVDLLLATQQTKMETRIKVERTVKRAKRKAKKKAKKKAKRKIKRRKKRIRSRTYRKSKL